jgi:hypothetical protein
MKKLLPFVVLLGCIANGVHAANELPATCIEIRTQIKTVTGLVTKPNKELLRHISTHQGCNFSTEEVFRAAYGDRPLPQPEAPNHHNHRDHDED